MANETYIICGDIVAEIPQNGRAKAYRLNLYGRNDDNKVTLQIEDIRRAMYKDVPDRFHDLLDIATYVFTADQAVVRGVKDVETFGSSWHRSLHFTIPVRSFLSDDQYSFSFVPLEHRAPFQTFLSFSEDEMQGMPEQVIMFSGGLDSLGGAVEEVINQRRRVVFVNHRATQKLDKRYQTIRDLLASKTPNTPPLHARVLQSPICLDSQAYASMRTVSSA